MATVRFKTSPGKTEFQVVQEVGAANNSDVVELTVDMATNLVNDKGTTRAVTKSEVLMALERIQNHILKANWPL